MRFRNRVYERRRAVLALLGFDPDTPTVIGGAGYDLGKDFCGGYSFMRQGPLAAEWAGIVASRGLWGMRLRREMTLYNHMAGLEIVGEVLPRRENRVELADEEDALGLRIPRVIFSYCDNDRCLQHHAVRFMSKVLRAAGGSHLWRGDDTAHLLGRLLGA